MFPPAAAVAAAKIEAWEIPLPLLLVLDDCIMMG
jgi:hypothetical protein